MFDTLRDLVAHQGWADAELWRAIEASQVTQKDPVLLARCHHIHLAQHAFAALVRGDPVATSKVEEFTGWSEIEAYGRRAFETWIELVDTLDGGELSQRLVLPWFKEPPLEITVGQAVLQMVMHSQHHRGQNATRLRELGGEPPLTDFVAWLWRSRPASRWAGSS